MYSKSFHYRSSDSQSNSNSNTGVSSSNNVGDNHTTEQGNTAATQLSKTFHSSRSSNNSKGELDAKTTIKSSKTMSYSDIAIAMLNQLETNATLYFENKEEKQTTMAGGKVIYRYLN